MLRWLLLDDGPMSGSENMARDEYIFSRVRERGDEVILRLYSFSPPALSIGFHQDHEKILDMATVKSDGLEVVRRITGGRALLHKDEFTYCIAAPTRCVRFGASLQEAFVSIARALISALGRLGVKARLSGAKKERGARGLTSPCLVSTSRYEITSGGRKIVGSAQRRSGESFLQHGSILVGDGSTAISRYLIGDWRSLGGYVTSIREQSGHWPEYDSLRDSVAGAFRESFKITFEKAALTPSEEKKVMSIAAEKSAEIYKATGG